MPITDSPLPERTTRPELANNNGALFVDAYRRDRDSSASRSEDFFQGGRSYREANEEEKFYPYTDPDEVKRFAHEMNLSALELIADSFEKRKDRKESEEQKDSKNFPKVDIRDLQELTRKAEGEQDAHYDNLQEKARKEERKSNDNRLLQLPYLAIESANEGKYSVDVLCLKQSPSESGNTATASSDRSEISLTEEEQRVSKAIESMGFNTSIAMGYDDTVKSIENPSSPPSGKKSCLVIRAEW